MCRLFFFSFFSPVHQDRFYSASLANQNHLQLQGESSASENRRIETIQFNCKTLALAAIVLPCSRAKKHKRAT